VRKIKTFLGNTVYIETSKERLRLFTDIISHNGAKSMSSEFNKKF